MNQPESKKPLPPGSTLGIIGGGQLGRMFVQSASKMGYRVSVLEPSADSPAAEVASEHIQAAYDDSAGLAELARKCDAVTTEFENVPADSLRVLQQSCVVSPPPDAVEIAQNRIREKTFFRQHGLPVNAFAAIQQEDQIVPAFDQMNARAVLKTTQFGYDGKGQCVCDSAAEVTAAFQQFGAVECILEEFVPFDCEVSVVLARDIQGHVETFPVVENQHLNGILDTCIVPARVPDKVAEEALSVATALAEAMNYVGVLAVEMFVTGESISLNEIAPRPHNSGHYTMDACNYSQFDQQVRTLAGLPAATIEHHQPVVMYNVLGDLVLTDGFEWESLQKICNAHVHVYGKKESRSGRKMGHINLLTNDIATGLATIDRIKQSQLSSCL